VNTGSNIVKEYEESQSLDRDVSLSGDNRGRRFRGLKRKDSLQSKTGPANDEEKQFFKDLLDTLLDVSSPATTVSHKFEQSVPTGSKGFSKIEQQLREMALNPPANTHRHQAKPYVMMDAFKKRAEVDKPIRKEQSGLWQEPARTRDVAKDEEFRELARISELKSGAELSQYVMDNLFKPNTVLDERYPSFLAATIKQAAGKLDDPYLALSIFQQSKARGVESYIAGCTTSVYNSILALRWEHWKDIHGMDAMIKEMVSNGVSFNDGTRRIVKDVVEEVEKDIGSDDIEEDGVKWSSAQRKLTDRMRSSVTKWIIK